MMVEPFITKMVGQTLAAVLIIVMSPISTFTPANDFIAPSLSAVTI